MFRALLDFHTVATKTRFKVYSVVFGVSSGYAVLNGILAWRAETRVAYETLALTCSLMIVGPFLQVHLARRAGTRDKRRIAALPPGVVEITQLLLLENFVLEDRLYAHATTAGGALTSNAAFYSVGMIARSGHTHEVESNEELS